MKTSTPEILDYPATFESLNEFNKALSSDKYKLVLPVSNSNATKRIQEMIAICNFTSVSLPVNVYVSLSQTKNQPDTHHDLTSLIGDNKRYPCASYTLTAGQKETIASNFKIEVSAVYKKKSKRNINKYGEVSALSSSATIINDSMTSVILEAGEGFVYVTKQNGYFVLERDPKPVESGAVGCAIDPDCNEFTDEDNFEITFRLCGMERTIIPPVTINTKYTGVLFQHNREYAVEILRKDINNDATKQNVPSYDGVKVMSSNAFKYNSVQKVKNGKGLFIFPNAAPGNNILEFEQRSLQQLQQHSNLQFAILD